MNQQEENKGVQMPVNRLSQSSLLLILRNPLIFKLNQILGVYTGKAGVSTMVGRAGHEALKFYYGGNKDFPVPADRNEAREEAIEFGIKYLEQQDDRDIRYGKTGSRELLFKKYMSAMRIYFESEPEYHEILICEDKLDAQMKTKDGDILPLPGTGKPDLVVKNEDGTVDIVDHKFVTTFTPYENEDGEPNEEPIKIIQAKFLDHLLLATKGIQARNCVYREIKYSENKDASQPQIRDYIIPLDHKPYDVAFYNIFNDVVKFLSNPNAIYLPNLMDKMDGSEAWTLYTQGLLNADMTDVEVMHRVKDVAFTTKKFIPSNLDRLENANLLPEEKIKVRLREFGVLVEPIEPIIGASMVQYRFKVSAGTRMSAFAKHKADIARAIEADGEIRILAPIKGTSYVGIEVPTAERKVVYMQPSDLVPNTLSIPIGFDVTGKTHKLLLNEMPHLLIAGTTGSGKSILVHGILTALTKQMTPEAMHLILIDPKRVELSAFSKVPHLQKAGIIYEHKMALRKLIALSDEMDERYKKLEKAQCRDIGEYNEEQKEKMPYKVILVDEFADLMLRGKMDDKKRSISYSSKSKRWLYNEIEKRGGKKGSIEIKDDEKGDEYGIRHMKIPAFGQLDKDGCIDILELNDMTDEINRTDANMELLMVRLAQLGRAAGIHLIIATQRPSVDVITGLIKANFPTRIGLTTSSPTDSEIILGERGTEKLNGKGDMLLMHPGTSGLLRLQSFMKEPKKCKK